MNPIDSEPDPRNSSANRMNVTDEMQPVSESTFVIPVIQEELTVGKQVVETGRVRLVKTVHEEQQMVSLPVTQEEISVERVAVDRLVDDAPAVRQEGDTVIYSVLKEEIVVTKRLRLVEEIRVTRRAVQTVDNQTVTLRREEITVDRSAIPLVERSDSPGESSL